ncbi:glucitol operon activator protein [Anaerosolibacter carboniphilus]|uniref:Glucitol operon activator protein n=1 Tax=Anaerosolibacter carboniphilus TaxID=1417629 RepID=A0A841KVK8_9FIRM|nr:transcriptional regulator GutM [Anaerosolibacter carboniphilus]MBB6217407.1 glucitol operon activator protein [Anaerosolibacter carboniphilus]
MEKIFIFAFGLLILQGVLSYWQIKNYRDRIHILNKAGIVGIGVEKGRIRAGNITILVCDKTGKIVKGEKMEGITVFTRFIEIPDIVGVSIKELKAENETRQNKIGVRAMRQAIEQLECKLVMK